MVLQINRGVRYPLAPDPPSIVRESGQNPASAQASRSRARSQPPSSRQSEHRKILCWKDPPVHPVPRQASPSWDGRARSRAVSQLARRRGAGGCVNSEPGAERAAVPLPPRLASRLAWLDDVVRARRPKRLPIVLTRDEVREVISKLDGTPRLMAVLLYGSGLRLLECARLRVQDVDFAMNQMIVRDGKGAKDRVTSCQPWPRNH